MNVRSRAAGWACAGAALLTAGAAAWGDHESRSGGRFVLADTLGRFDWLYLVALALALAAATLLRSTPARIAATIGLGLAAAFWGVSVVLPLVIGNDINQEVTRSEAPDGADRALLVVHNRWYGEAEDQEWTVQVENGSGWSGRRWTVFTAVGNRPGEGVFDSATWAGPDRVVVTTDTDSRIFDLSGDRPVLVSTTPA